MSEEITGVVYKITNTINNEVYIGQTIHDIEIRWRVHNSQHSGCTRLKEALNRYGKENFTIEVIETVGCIDRLNERENYYIEFYRSLSPLGYNLKVGGNNRRMSEETKKRISRGNTGKTRTQEVKDKLSRAKVGKKRSLSARKNLSEYNKNKKLSASWKENISKSKMGVKHPKTPFNVFDEDNNLIGTWTNKAECSRILNIKRSGIYQSLKYKTDYDGLTFKYKEVYNRQ